jgi:GAF domain-containing protein
MRSSGSSSRVPSTIADGGGKIVSEEKDKPVFDEQLLTTLLEAAYVLQEHNRELQAMELHVEPQDLAAQDLAPQQNAASPAPGNENAESGTAPRDYTFTLGQIVETQHQIQVRQLELESALSLVAERAAEIARATGASVGILDGRKVRYKAVSGLMTLPAGAEVAMEKALCVACLRTGQVIRCADVNAEFLLDIEECHRRGIQSMIAVPVYHDGGIAGGLELYYAGTQAFTEQDVHTCQLMAGLVTEALARDEELAWKRSLATERAAMMDALEKLKPRLAGFANSSAVRGSAPRTVAPARATSHSAFRCTACGNELVGEEQFCGECGSPRGAVTPMLEPAEQRLHNTETAERRNGSGVHQNELATTGMEQSESRKALAEPVEENVPALSAATEPQAGEGETALQFSETAPLAETTETAGEIRILPEPAIEENEEVPANSKLVKAQLGAWTSAATTRAFLEQLTPARSGAFARFWNARRGDFYLAIAVILVACVIRWGLWPDGSVSATGNPTAATAAANHKPAVDPDLSLFDRMLISLGLAEAPEAPADSGGNPDTTVWVDLHTALYYCPGTDLYGKTPKGKFTTQRDAQLDQFEPAYRKACD